MLAGSSVWFGLSWHRSTSTRLKALACIVPVSNVRAQVEKELILRSSKFLGLSTLRHMAFSCLGQSAPRTKARSQSPIGSMPWLWRANPSEIAICLERGNPKREWWEEPFGTSQARYFHNLWNGKRSHLDESNLTCV